MLKLLRLGLLVLLTLTAALPMVAQVRHVTTVNPMTKQSHIEVYEFDYVDIQPRSYQFHQQNPRISLSRLQKSHPGTRAVQFYRRHRRTCE